MAEQIVSACVVLLLEVRVGVADQGGGGGALGVTG